MKAIKALKSRLSKNNTLFAQNEGGHLPEAGFEWSKAAINEEIRNFEIKIQIECQIHIKSF